MTHPVTVLAALLTAGTLSAQSFPSRQLPSESQVVARLHAERSRHGLRSHESFRTLAVIRGERDREIHRIQHLYEGVPVWGSEVVVHVEDQGTQQTLATDALRRGIVVDTEPLLTTSEAMAQAHRHLAPRSVNAFPSRSNLVIFPITDRVRAEGAEDKSEAELNALDVREVVRSYRLAYHISVRGKSPAGELNFYDMLVDAHTGEELKRWDMLVSADGTGKSQYSGTVSVPTTLSGSTYQLKDSTRAGNYVYNLNNQETTSGSIYTDADNTWGDGAQYSGGSTTGANGQTAAVDAMWGLTSTYDMLNNVFGYKGLDGNNKAGYIGVHYGNGVDNAYFMYDCSCMVIGDGKSMFYTLASVDVIAHEFGHGVTYYNSNMTYSGESGGLNEAFSDWNGEAVEAYAKAGKTGSTIPAGYNDWMTGKQIGRNGNPLRYLYKPSLDGASKDAWYSGIGNIDVHYSSGPGNRMFYFLSQGSTASGNTSSSYLTKGAMTGVGIDKAYRILFNAATNRFTSGTTYSQARTHALAEAAALYGTNSVERNAVDRAFAAINVGTDPGPIQTGVSISGHPANLTKAVGESASFTVTATGGTSPYKYQWYKNGTAVSGATSATYTFTVAAGDNGAKLKATVTDSATTPTSATSNEATLTVPSNQLAITSQPANTTVAPGSTASFSVTAAGGTAPYKYQWYRGQTAISGATAATYSFTAVAADNGATFKVVVSDSAATPASLTSSTATLTVGTGTEKIVNGGFEATSTSPWVGSTGAIANWTSQGQPAYEGSKSAFLLGYGNGSIVTETLYQTVTIPSTATNATLSFYLHIDTAETEAVAYDKLNVQVRNSSGTVLKTLATYSNLNAAAGYQPCTFDLSAYQGQTVRIYFGATEDQYAQTSFVFDKVSLIVK